MILHSYKKYTYTQFVRIIGYSSDQLFLPIKRGKILLFAKWLETVVLVTKKNNLKKPSNSCE